jgi:hypothetical protein
MKRKQESEVRSQKSEFRHALWRALQRAAPAFVPVLALACQEVDHGRLRGADLAAANPAFAAVDPALDLGPAPMPGIPRVFRAAELMRVARRTGLAPDPSRAEVCFERATQRLDRETLLPVLSAALKSETALKDDAAGIEILDISRYKVALGRIEFTRAGLTASGMWHGQVIDADGRGAPVWVRVRIASAATGEPSPLAPDVAPREGAPREVERGDAVRVDVHSGGVLLGFDGSAETAGRAGEWVLVKNPATGRRLRARVESKGKVTVSR